MVPPRAVGQIIRNDRATTVLSTPPAPAITITGRSALSTRADHAKQVLHRRGMTDQRQRRDRWRVRPGGLRGLRAGIGAAHAARQRLARGHQVGQVEGLGQIIERPRPSVARMAVTMVFWAEITITGRSGRASGSPGIMSMPLPSGIITSVMTRSPRPHRPIARSWFSEPVACTRQPARVSACVSTVRMVRSSSAIRTVPSMGNLRLWAGQSKTCPGRDPSAIQAP